MPSTSLASIAARAWLSQAVLLLVWTNLFWFSVDFQTPWGFARIETFRAQSIIRYWEPSLSAVNSFRVGTQPRLRTDPAIEGIEGLSSSIFLQRRLSIPGLHIWGRHPTDTTGTNKYVLVLSHFLILVAACFFWGAQHLLSRLRYKRAKAELSVESEKG